MKCSEDNIQIMDNQHLNLYNSMLSLYNQNELLHENI